MDIENGASRKLNWTYLDDEFYFFLSNMSCLIVMKLPYDSRCDMAKKVSNCHEIINLFNYFEMMYCTFYIHDKITEVLVMFLFMLMVLVLLVLMSYTIDVLFGPTLKILSVKMHMNEYLAGVTLLAFGNSCPDFIANLMPIRAESPYFTICTANALAVITLSGGMICFIKPFKMHGPSTIRDLLFLLLGAELLRFVMFHGGRVTFIESLVLLSVFGFYLIINIVDLIWLRYTIRELRREIWELRLMPPTPQRDALVSKKMSELFTLEEDDTIHIHDSLGRSSLDNGFGFATPRPAERPAPVDIEATRKILHSENNPRNIFLISEFFESLIPINLEEWERSGWFCRIFMIFRSPIVLMVTLLVPIVDYEKDKHGWSKLLNCTHIITNPFVTITLVHSMIASQYSDWSLDLNFGYSKWSACVTLPLAIIVFFHSRTDIPPSYHFLFMIMSAASSLLIIMICATEMEVLSYIVGIVLELTGNFMVVTFGAIANGTGDLLANLALATQGYEKMAFAAMIGGPLFSTVVGTGVAFLFNERVGQPGSTFWMYGEHGENCYIFFVIVIVCTLWWCLTFNFYARRSAAIFLWSVFLLFLIFSIGVEMDIVHEFSDDAFFEPM